MYQAAEATASSDGDWVAPTSLVSFHNCFSLSFPQHEVQGLKEQLNDRPRSSSLATVGVSSTESDVLAFIDTLVHEMNDNIEERINLQKALFEIEDANIFNRYVEGA